jgi:hypothetical protein
MIELDDGDAAVVVDVLTRVSELLDSFDGYANYPKDVPAYDALVSMQGEVRDVLSDQCKSVARRVRQGLAFGG